MERGHVEAKVEIKITTSALGGEGQKRVEGNQEGETERDVQDTESNNEEEDKGEKQEDIGDGEDDDDDELPAAPLHPAGLKPLGLGMCSVLSHTKIVVLIFRGACFLALWSTDY